MSDSMRELIQKMLTEDSDFELWRKVASLGFDREATNEPLKRVQQIAMGTWEASGLIGNRGFFDHSDEDMVAWARAYDGLGISEAAEAIRQAAVIMPRVDWQASDPLEEQLEPIERRFYTANRQTESAIAAMIRGNPDDAFWGFKTRAEALQSAPVEHLKRVRSYNLDVLRRIRLARPHRDHAQAEEKAMKDLQEIEREIARRESDKAS